MTDATMRTLALAAVLLAGCADPGQPPQEQEFVPMRASGSSHFKAALSQCDGQDHCSWTLPLVHREGSFTVPTDSTNGTLTAEWDAGPTVPARWKLYVSIERDGWAGAWGIGEGTSPLTIPLCTPLINGTYLVWGYPSESSVGTLDATIRWTAQWDAPRHRLPGPDITCDFEYPG